MITLSVRILVASFFMQTMRVFIGLCVLHDTIVSALLNNAYITLHQTAINCSFFAWFDVSLFWFLFSII
jgi:hypothetical protein